MTFTNPAALWLLTALIPVIALHLLKPRRADTVVSSGMLWEPDTVGATAARPWQRLPPTLSLLLQILAVVLATLALANPVIRSETGLADHTVVVLDASASMAARDGDDSIATTDSDDSADDDADDAAGGGEAGRSAGGVTGDDRLAEAKAQALALWDERPEGGVISVVAGGPRPRVAITATSDREAYEGAIDAIAQTDGPLDLAAAMSLADGLETIDTTIGIVLISDGGHADDDLRSLPPGVTHRLVGDGDVNRAITSLVVVPEGPDATGLRAVATVAVTGGPAVTVPVRFDVDGATAVVEDIEVGPDNPVSVEVQLPAGDEVIARLGGQDLLAVDDTAYALARRSEQVAVALEGSDPFVETLIESLPGVDLVDSATAVPDLTVFAGVPVPEDIARPFWAINPPEGFAGITPSGTVEAPVPTLIRTTDRLLVGLDLSRFRVAEAQQLSAPTAETLIGAEGAPLVLRGRRAGLPFVYTGFDLAQSTLPLDVSFPILGDRILQELAGSGTVPTSIRVGTELTPPVGRTSVIANPVGNEVTLTSGAGSVTVDRPGFWSVTPDEGRPIVVAANLPASESELAPLPVAPSEPRALRFGEEPPSIDQSWRWLILVALAAVIALEWWRWLPRAGVPRWQRRSANLLRALALGALVLAVIDFSLPVPTRQVATVFVIDRSDSVGPAGRQAADRWVADAIDARLADDDTARSATVLVGDGARVEQLLRQRDRIGSTGLIEIDSDRTDLASGLRLAGALLPDDARRRVVVLSDGRATTGNAAAEATALAQRGIVVDYAVLDGGTGADASVAGVQAPTSVADGEAVVLEATIASTVAQDALVTLTRNGEVAGSTDVTLSAGRTVVSLRDRPPSGGLVTYDVTVQTALDDQPRNDTGRTVVEVEGDARVLVVEGPDGAADSLIASLEVTEITVVKIGPNSLPALNELAGFESVVLVDVDADTLSEQQQLDLVANTRDLGRGLVTIGGPQSYGMGGYLDSTLEQALPVVSDILDPRRRRTVAQVFALDTSESMGNCHCAEGDMGESRIPGGVTKTEIARAGTARAISGLTPNDEIGLISVDTQSQWLLDLQQMPSNEVLEESLALVTPAGNTNLEDTLATAAEQLRTSNAGLKHIILFTDGFTPAGSMRILEDDAAALYNDEGITVSVVGTGEGASRELRAIAEAGGGRFYPGRDLARIPEILVQESVIASRSFINEGEFFPIITGPSPVIDGVASTPALYGFVATTAKSTSTQVLSIGEEQDPLLATWRIGLGRSSSWTSDAGRRWANEWTAWSGSPEFWTRLVRDTFPLDDGGSVRATVDGDRLRVRIETPPSLVSDGDGESDGSDPAATPVGAVTATVTDPDGRRRDFDLTSTADGVYVGEVSVGSAGTYSVAAGIPGQGGVEVVGADLATVAYAAEYLPGSTNEALLQRIAEASGGRGAIEPEDAFSGEGLDASARRISLSGWLLGTAVALWLVALVLSRLWIRGRAPTAAMLTRSSKPVPAADQSPSSPAPSADPASSEDSDASPDSGGSGLLARMVRRSPSSTMSTEGKASSGDQTVPAPPPDPDAPPPPEPPAGATSMSELLKAKRERKD